MRQANPGDHDDLVVERLQPRHDAERRELTEKQEQMREKRRERDAGMPPEPSVDEKKSRLRMDICNGYPLCVEGPEGPDGTVVISILGGTHGYAVCCMSVECKKVDISHPGARALVRSTRRTL